MDQASAPRPRERHALGGRSTPVDPRIEAVRADLADIRLADRVFAPHYAAPMPRQILTASPLRQSRDVESLVLSELAAGDMFEVLEVTRRFAWGRAPAVALVGYVDSAALGIED